MAVTDRTQGRTLERPTKVPSKATPSGSPRNQEAVSGWPGLRRAADIIGVDVSSLSRADLPVERWGREKRLPPSVVLDRAAYYNRRPVDEVAAELVQCALDQSSPEVVERVELEIDAALRALRATAPAAGPPGWLEEARRALPAELYREVEATVHGDQHIHPGLRGNRPEGRG
jgi:hypothetical protein